MAEGRHKRRAFSHLAAVTLTSSPYTSNAKRLTTQNKKRMTTINPPMPLTTVLQKMPLAAATEAFFVSSATWPEASKPIKTPAVAR
jgi:hypothetical protein